MKTKWLHGLGLLAMSSGLVGCLESMMAGAYKKDYLKVLAEQSGPILQLEADLKGGKKLSFDEAKTGLASVQTCISAMPDVMKAGKQETGTAYVDLNDDIPVANGPIKVGAYYKTCSSLLKKIAKMEYDTCLQRDLEWRATGRGGSFGDFAAYSADWNCKSSRPCYEKAISKPENFVAANCEDSVEENIPDEFKSAERKLKKLCGSDAKVVFADGGVKVDVHVYDKLLSTKTALLKCYKAKSKGKPFAKNTDLLKAQKEAEPELYKVVYGK